MKTNETMRFYRTCNGIFGFLDALDNEVRALKGNHYKVSYTTIDREYVDTLKCTSLGIFSMREIVKSASRNIGRMNSPCNDLCRLISEYSPEKDTFTYEYASNHGWYQLTRIKDFIVNCIENEQPFDIEKFHFKP
jgi:hypothetical protein